jgi:hypothetical protein
LKLVTKHTFIISIILFSYVAKAQDKRGNLPNYFKEPLHFGFALGINRANFIIQPAPHFERFDSLKSVTSSTKAGFSLGIVSELGLNDYFTLRFLPNLCFAERNLQYAFAGFDTVVRTKTVESTFLNFPVDLKLRSKRIENFDAYVVAGGGYSLDLASKRKSVNATAINDQIVKLKRDDFFYEFGAGAEFYLEYFKFAIEAKMSIGGKNLLIKDNTIFSNSVDKLNSKVFLVSITFEG